MSGECTVKRSRIIALLIVLAFSIVSGCTPKNSEVDNPNQNIIDERATDGKETAENTEPSSKPGSKTLPEEEPIVYMTKDISPEGLIRIYEALGRQATGKVGIKVHMGEPGGHNYLNPDLIKDFVLSVNGTFVDCNTAYGGLRATTAMHMQAAKDHGFTAYTSVDIMDAEAEISLPIENGKHLKEALVGSHFKDYDFFVVLSHFKGHEMGGFGGAIKNMSIGFSSQKGKNLIHNAGVRDTNSWLYGGYVQDHFLESMAEAAKAVADYAGENILYINVMNNLSIDCDCNSNPASPQLEDIGILASLDPVALDKACVDQVFAADEEKSASLRRRIKLMNGTHTLDYAEEIGLGTQKYKLEVIDD
ncbi:MAG: DUF362 domain-containing protein [Clostridium sp.]|nr:DUF362 domain-containing protein [Clostridium sp.]